ncbi:superoxide dismutase [Fe] [Novosphingobium marinum]|uniref:Superoxide dismutase n=1 Tax=Novosphingobium marinum TaxID=1514948 RepID=A0A7Y9XVC0_9SPHN|nr:superoxide dismutase [Novosphingobium marinum]NYH93796.1 Fe-Mn family superoxide dismutase [Novosphingobium marinum]GGC17328.1 superoxide dismutase [Fe] [Novosphingobium marinum]
MTISLMPLPYSHDALAPHISAETLETHHGKHHKGYVDKVNAGIEGTDMAGADLETIVKKSSGGLFNSAAQTWNHGFYWHSMSPDGSQPSDALAKAIDASFGSVDALKEKLSEEAVGHFASGWAWLVADGDSLKVISTHDAETAITEGVNPLLTIDVWEHAYYIDVKNKRPEYVNAVLGNIVNWKFASENFERGTAWVYPS